MPYTTVSLRTSLSCSSQKLNREQTQSGCRRSGGRLKKHFRSFLHFMPGPLIDQHFSAASASVKYFKDAGEQTEIQ